MDVRTFEAFTMRDALKAVKSHFGNDAVILSTREKSGEGSRRGKLYEVTAAKASEVKVKGAEAASHDTNRDALFEMMDYFKTIERNIKAMSDDLAKRQDLFRLDAGLHEVRTMVYELGKEKIDHITHGMTEPMALVFQRLQLMGVLDSEQSRLAEYLKAVNVGSEAPEQLAQIYQSHAIRWMMKKIKVAPLWSSKTGEQGVHVVVGSSGAGKSSVLAKIAASYQQRHQQKIILVSADNKRLAAREQMRILAKVLDVPYENIENGDELPDVLKKHKGWDLCLVDTAAECPRSKDDLHDLMEFKKLELPVNFHLVLSITEKEAQMDRMIRGFSPLGLNSLIFNKLDESWSYGEMLNLCIKWSLPLGYFGVGRSIPEDLERASRERVVERIFGL